MTTPLTFAANGPVATATTQVHVHPPAAAAVPAPEPVSTSAVPSMEQWRDQQFRDLVVDRLRAGKTAGLMPDQIFASLAAEQQALALAITGPEFIGASAQLLFKAKQAVIADPSFITTETEATETMVQILHRRAEEAKGYAALANDPAFRMETQSAADAVNDRRFTTTSLQEVKRTETVDDLLHRGADGAPQVLAHLDAFRDGNLITHRALMQVFTPDGALYQPLMDTLKTHLPNATPDQLQAVAATWLNDRHAAAAVTVDLLGNEGAAYQQAVAESTNYHRAKLGIAPAASHTQRLKDSKAAILTMDV